METTHFNHSEEILNYFLKDSSEKNVKIHGASGALSRIRTYYTITVADKF